MHSSARDGASAGYEPLAKCMSCGAPWHLWYFVEDRSENGAVTCQQCKHQKLCGSGVGRDGSILGETGRAGEA